VRPIVVYTQAEPARATPPPRRTAKPKPKAIKAAAPKPAPKRTPMPARQVAGEPREPVAIFAGFAERNDALLLVAAVILGVAALGSGIIAVGIRRELQVG
jgi:hypothetical protein